MTNRRRSLLVVAVVLLAACGSTAAPASIAPFMTPSSVVTPVTSVAAVSPPSDAAAPASMTAEPVTASPMVCMVAFPSQVGTDHTPVTIKYPGATTSLCASYLVQHNPSAWAKAHPPTYAARVPAGKPVCQRSVKGIVYIVYGTSAATFVCAALK